jgi:hypothetical protein
MDAGRVKRKVLVALAAIVAALAVYAWSQYSARMEAERTLGLNAARVLSEHFSKAAALKVATLSGRVVAQGEDKGFLGLVPTEQRTATPFTVDYFVDLSRLGPSAYRWDPETRTMTIDIPDVTVGKPNIDEARARSEQEGLFISRRAALALAREASARATAASRTAAAKPEHLDRARANARTVVANLAAAPLAAAGLEDVRVAVSFPWEPKAGSADPAQMDRSRRIEEVLNDSKP